MAYDTKLEERIDKLVGDWGLAKENMFGGIGYLAGGNMAFGIHKDELIIRAAEEQGKNLLSKPGMRIFDMTGRPMKNWLMAGKAAIQTDGQLNGLLKIGYDFALSLPSK